MKTVESAITIRGTPEQVWSVLTNFTEYSEWNPFIREASGEAKRGARLRVRIHPPDGSPMTFRPTVQEASPARELRWLGHLWLPGLFDGEHVFYIEPADPGHTCFRQSEQFRGVLVRLFPATVFERTQRGFEAMNRALKERVERLHA